METVVLVGLGNLGSRHLQGLVHCERPLRIALVDPSAAAIERAHERWADAGGEDSPYRIDDGVGDNVDLAIIATTADHRLAAISRSERKLLEALIPHRAASGGPADRLDVT